MKFLHFTKLHRKSGGSPPLFALDAEISAVTSFWESIGNRSSSSQVPRISCRGWWRVELHAAFLEESRTRGPVWCCAAGNPDALGRTWAPPTLRDISGKKSRAIIAALYCGDLTFENSVVSLRINRPEQEPVAGGKGPIGHQARPGGSCHE